MRPPTAILSGLINTPFSAARIPRLFVQLGRRQQEGTRTSGVC